jgi:hypothetical protein
VDALLDALARREVVIGLAIIGAALATVGSLARGRKPSVRRYADLVVYAGYAITGLSMLLFISAGFRA